VKNDLTFIAADLMGLLALLPTQRSAIKGWVAIVVNA